MEGATIASMMAPVEHTIPLSHLENVSDSTRARELYKYYQPNATTLEPLLAPPVQDVMYESDSGGNVDSNVGSSKQSSPDTALTAFCQLVALRTDSRRAMISVIDVATQYFIAEGTKTLDLIDSNKHEPGDGLWVGCTSVDKAGRLCEYTIAVKPTAENDYPAFIVNDLSKDARFSELDFVKEGPCMRFYAGVPLITKRGIPIGSLFVVDERPRDSVKREDLRLMDTMAKTVMKHLEMGREVEEHRRGMKMSRGLASFVEGRTELQEAEADGGNGEGTKVAGQFESSFGLSRTKSKTSSIPSKTSRNGSTASVDRFSREPASSAKNDESPLFSSAATTHKDSTVSSTDHLADDTVTSNADLSGSSSTPTADNLEKFTPRSDEDLESSSLLRLFSRAANLIREAFEIEGGTVFYDAQKGISSELSEAAQNPSFISETSQQSQNTTDAEMQFQSGTASDHPEPPIKPPQRAFSISSSDTRKAVEVLGFSTPDAASANGDQYPGPSSFIPFDEQALDTLLRRYPRGKLWTFDSDGAVTSSEEDEMASHALYRKRSSHQKRDPKDLKIKQRRSKSAAKFLTSHFPGVRQLLFVPLWDAGRSRWLSGCFAWSMEPTRVLTRQHELAFLTAFGNSVMAECSRLDTEIADQKKSDFIGSISHELRSPLHGILASSEFLSDEVDTSFERGLVETIDSCGRTLLDTINHILDFSKINHFEKNWRKNTRASRRYTPRIGGDVSQRQSELPMINLFADIDIATVCEEVVEGVFAGHVFQNVTAQSFNMGPETGSARSDLRKKSTSSDNLSNMKEPPQVSVILDINMQNYQFTTQPGAFRRIVMNLLGNSLKYTSHGYVRVTLQIQDLENLQLPGTTESVRRSVAVLTVTDTGRGISSEFLRSKLFTPFAQENSLSNGTGLGLSIVRSIIALLEGEISINSELGRGTQVKVTLPLIREMPKHMELQDNTPKSASSLSYDVDDSMEMLRSQVVGQTVAICGFDIQTEDPIMKQMHGLLKDSITNFLTNWYGLKVVSPQEKPSIIVANEADTKMVTQYIEMFATQRRKTALLVLCSHSSRFDRALSLGSSKGSVGYVAKPVGPFKLAKALLQCLAGIAPPTTFTPGINADPAARQLAPSSDLSKVFEELSLSPRGGEVLDNSRMASDSDNARKAIESPTPSALEKNNEFPFPIPATATGSVPAAAITTTPALARNPPTTIIPERRPDFKPGPFTISNTPLPAVITAPGKPVSPQLAPRLLASTGVGTSIGLPIPPMPITPTNPVPALPLAKLAKPRNPAQPKLNSPTLLLVDDNKINLSLLRTYMVKRNYAVVHEAENGLEAVQRMQDRPAGYDIIFMDISMPVLDGFGATRQIRSIEAHRRKEAIEARQLVKTDFILPGSLPADTLASGKAQAGKNVSPNEQKATDTGGLATEIASQGRKELVDNLTPALVIALTGLASSRDQSEAFTSGIDLFLTKPVSFKEVGKMLDNWEANKERDARGAEEKRP